MPDILPEDELPPPPGPPAIDRYATAVRPVAPGPSGPPAIDGYEIGEQVGRGGMAVVYKARQRSLNRPVALKVLLVGGHADPDERNRVRTEAEAIARLQHPNVVHVYEVGERDNWPYLLMEYVDGGTLADRLRAGPVPAARAAEWAEAIARGIHAAHQKGIVHRDLKPANVLMTADGVPKITDFGIARLDDAANRTRTGMVVGTPAYMAPEQAEGKKGVGPAADVWAVGAILYEMLTGRPPFEGESSLDLLRRVSTDTPPRPSKLRPDVPPRLEAVCLRCLQKNPAARYPTAAALADDLARARTDPAPVARRSVRRWAVPLAVGIGGLLAILLVAMKWPGGGGSDRNGGSPAVVPPGPVAPTGDVAGRSGVESGPPPPAPGWKLFQITREDELFERLAFPSRDTGFAASRAGVYRTDDGGQTWQKTWGHSLGPVHFLTFADPDRGWLGAERLYQTTDGGRKWTDGSLPDVSSVRALAVAPGGWALTGGPAAGGEPTLFRRLPGKDDWEELDPVKTGLWGGEKQPYRDWILTGLAVASPGNGWAVLARLDPQTEGGVVLRTTDGGEKWASVTPADASGTSLWHVHFADDRRGWLAGLRGKLWTTTDGGASWTPQQNPAGDISVSGLAFARIGELFGLAPLLGGDVLRTVDGQSWVMEKVGLEYATPAAAVVERGRAYVLGSDGRIARYTDPQEKP